MPEPIISVRDIHKSYKNVHALQGVSFDVNEGTIFGLLGPNGAGKTTLVNILTTLLKPTHGTALIAGIDVTKHPKTVRNLIGLAGQYAAVDENLTGKENLEMIGSLYHLPRAQVKRRAQKLLDEFSLTDAANRTVKTYSGGMRRRIDVASSLIGEPKILFLDEPTTGLDPQSRIELWEVIEHLVKGGTTVLLTTQYLEEIDRLANTIVIIDQGRVVAQGTTKELKAHIGSGVLEIHPADKHHLAALANALYEYHPHIDMASGLVSFSVHEGSKTLPEMIRKVDVAGIEISDIELRKPTLDEVFLELTKK